jgi:hypothetical protein
MSAANGMPAPQTVVDVDADAGSAAPDPAAAPVGMFARRPGESAAVMVELAEVHAAEAEAARRSWAAGLEGERRVAAELAALDSSAWWVFHDLPIGSRGAKIDHLVIGVGGVFCIKTENHGTADVSVSPRTIKVNGAINNDYLPQAVREADHVGRQLAAAGAKVTVVPVLAFLAGRVTITESPTNVAVMHYSRLRNWLETMPIAYAADAAFRIVVAADRPETWAPAQ